MFDWKIAQISNTASIKEAMQAIEAGGLRLAFVVDNNGTLKGVISDSDIRRALLKHSKIDDSINDTYKKNPYALSISSTKAERLNLLKSKNLQCLPIIDDKKRIINIATIASLDNEMPQPNPVLIMAGGEGLRLRPLTEQCPKPMLVVGDKPMLEHLILKLKSQGFKHFFLSVYYKANIIKDYFLDGRSLGVKIEYLEETAPMGTGGAINLLPKIEYTHPLLMLNADVLIDTHFPSLIRHHQKNTFDITMCVSEIQHQVAYGVVKSENNKVISLHEKPTFNYDINTGIYVLSEQMLNNFKINVKCDMPEIIEKRMELGFKIGIFRHTKYWLDMGNHNDLEKANRDIGWVYYGEESQ